MGSDRGGCGRRWARSATLALAGLAAAACASPYFVPPGSRPAALARPYPQRDWAQLLLGRWRVVAVSNPKGANAIGNLIQRAADVAGVSAWSEITFSPLSRPGQANLSLSAPGHQATLDYWIEGDLLAVAQGSPPLGHEHWQPNLANGRLFLRSLDDGQLISLRRP